MAFSSVFDWCEYLFGHKFHTAGEVGQGVLQWFRDQLKEFYGVKIQKLRWGKHVAVDCLKN